MRKHCPPLFIMIFALSLSGACGLALQMVWMRQMRLTLGSTTEATATVLAVFMGGLGLGTAFFGKKADTTSSPWKLYALLELGVALGALVSPWLLQVVDLSLIALGGSTALGNMGSLVLRFSVACIVFGIPAFFMGGTFPAAVATVCNEADNQRSRAGIIYAANTLGAVIGCILVNFFFLEVFGANATLFLSCLVLLTTFTLIFFYRWTSNTLPTEVDRRKPEISAQEPVPPSSPNSLTVLELMSIAALVGCIFFLMEMVWYRMLAPLLGGTTYSFGVILAAVLAGIGLGGGFYAALSKKLPIGRLLLSTTCLLEALSLGLPLFFGDSFAIELLSAQEKVVSFRDQVLLWTIAAAIVVGPASFLAGFQFPLLLALAGKGHQEVGSHIGKIYGANTIGAIGGSLLGGFFLLPAIGAVRLWYISCALLMIISVYIMGSRNLLSIEYLKKNLVFLVAFFAIFSVFGILLAYSLGPTAVWRHGGIGAGRAAGVDLSTNRARRKFANEIRNSLVWEKDGRESSVAIMANDGFSFWVNGKSDGNVLSDAETQVGLGILGPLLLPSAKTAFVVGLGTGQTAGWLADVGGIRNVEVAELEPTVLEMAQRCSNLNRQVLDHSEVKVLHADARERLQTSTNRYDLIISEPSNPYRAGVSSLYTREFYKSARSRLAEGGLFLQWLQAYEIDELTVRIVLATLREQFSSVEVWRTLDCDLILVGRCEEPPESLSVPNLDTDSVLMEALGSIWQVSDLEGIAARFLAGPLTVDRWLGEFKVPINTDDINLLEYAFAKSLGSKASSFKYERLTRLAESMGDDTPKYWRQFLDLQRIRSRRIALDYDVSAREGVECGLLKEEVWATLSPAWSANSSVRDAFLATLHGESKAFVELSGHLVEAGSCPIWDRVSCLNSSNLNLPINTRALQSLRSYREADYWAVRAVASMNAREFTEMESAIIHWCETLRRNPWCSSEPSNAAWRILYESAKSDQKLARKWYECLREPFCGGRFESKRRALLFVMAEGLGDHELAEAISFYEPWVPWQADLLMRRSEVYLRMKDVRAERARQEISEYWRN